MMTTQGKDDFKELPTDVLVDRKESLRKEIDSLHLVATRKIDERKKKFRRTFILLLVTVGMGLVYRAIYGVQTGGAPSFPIIVFALIVFGCVITLSNLPAKISGEEIEESRLRKEYAKVLEILYDKNVLSESENEEIKKRISQK